MAQISTLEVTKQWRHRGQCAEGNQAKLRDCPGHYCLLRMNLEANSIVLHDGAHPGDLGTPLDFDAFRALAALMEFLLQQVPTKYGVGA